MQASFAGTLVLAPVVPASASVAAFVIAVVLLTVITRVDPTHARVGWDESTPLIQRSAARQNVGELLLQTRASGPVRGPVGDVVIRELSDARAIVVHGVEVNFRDRRVPARKDDLLAVG